jgi:transcriptional regulator with XRE-family HTH domain
LSAGGLLIETGERLRVGETLAVSLPHGGWHEATVVWSSSRFHGCRFAEALTAAVLSAAQLKAEPGGGRENAEGLPARLSALRQARGLTGEQLARRIGVSRQALWYWETGRRTPRPEQLAKVAEQLGVDEAELRAGASEPAARAEVIRECRRRVADQFGVDPASVRIMVEL